MKFSIPSFGFLATYGLLQQPASSQTTYVDDCLRTAIADDKCCDTSTGANVCHGAGYNGMFTVSRGSCNGNQVCQETANWLGTAVIGENSCNAFSGQYGLGSVDGFTCYRAGYNSGSFKVGSDSCTGSESCSNAGKDSGFALIGDGSCDGPHAACKFAGISWGGTTGSATIADGSCIGKEACVNVGTKGGTIVIGANSCKGDNACDNAASPFEDTGTSDNVIIGDNSCEGLLACKDLGKAGGTTVVGHNSCRCENCCTCLQDKSAVFIPDYSCNALEDGTNGDQCCRDATTVGGLDTSSVTTVIPTAPGQGQTFHLQDYAVPPPVCSITDDDNVKCNFTGIVPAAGKLVYSITGFDACEGTATRDSLMSLSATAATAAAGANSVTIDLTTDFNLANGAEEAFQFCLLTSLQDGSGNEMIYQGQKISATFVADGDFTVSNIATEEFDGISGVVADDQKTFGIDAYRCTIDRTPLATAGPLAVGTTLFICIDSTDDSAVIDSVNTFVGRKNSEEIDLLSGNTEVLGAGTGAVTIGSRPFASFFANTDPLEIFGTVSLDVTDNNGTNRRQLLRVLQSSQSEEFDLKVELEAVEESSASTSGFGTTAAALLGAVAAAVV